jgi:hypothetical protein
MLRWLKVNLCRRKRYNTRINCEMMCLTCFCCCFQDICVLRTADRTFQHWLEFERRDLKIFDEIIIFAWEKEENMPLNFQPFVQKTDLNFVYKSMFRYTGVYLQDGHSGSPILIQRGNSVVVVGVHSYANDNTQQIPELVATKAKKQKPNSDQESSASIGSLADALAVVRQNQHVHSAYFAGCSVSSVFDVLQAQMNISFG